MLQRIQSSTHTVQEASQDAHKVRGGESCSCLTPIKIPVIQNKGTYKSAMSSLKRELYAFKGLRTRLKSGVVFELGGYRE